MNIKGFDKKVAELETIKQAINQCEMRVQTLKKLVNQEVGGSK